MDLSFLGPSAATVIVVLLFLKFLGTVVDKITKALEGLAKSNERVAKATEKTAKEAKERNGHLAELAVENSKANADANRAILEAVSNITVQHVVTQNVDKQTVQK